MARFDPERLHRRSIRAKGFDYALPGMYFVIHLRAGRALLFGEVDHDEVSLSLEGLMVESWWHAITDAILRTVLDAMVVMPNHFHGIVVIEAPEDHVTSADGEQGRHIGLPLRIAIGLAGADRRIPVPRPPSLPRIVQWFKTMTTNDYLDGIKITACRQFVTASGNATTTNTSSATNETWTESAPTSPLTHPNGHTTTRIRIWQPGNRCRGRPMCLPSHRPTLSSLEPNLSKYLLPRQSPLPTPPQPPAGTASSPGGKGTGRSLA